MDIWKSNGFLYTKCIIGYLMDIWIPYGYFKLVILIISNVDLNTKWIFGYLIDILIPNEYLET